VEQVEKRLTEMVKDMDGKMCSNRLFSRSYFHGSTISAVLVMRNFLFMLNVGDSRAVVWIDEIKHETRDHKPYDEKEEERIKSVGGFVRRDRVLGFLALSRSMGDCDYKRKGIPKPFLAGRYKADGWISSVPDITSIDIRPGAKVRIVVATDGLWDVVDPSNVKLFLSPKVEKPAAVLKQVAVRSGSNDDITIVVDEFETQSFPGSQETKRID
jgi:protein phosphatase